VTPEGFLLTPNDLATGSCLQCVKHFFEDLTLVHDRESPSSGRQNCGTNKDKRQTLACSAYFAVTHTQKKRHLTRESHKYKPAQLTKTEFSL
jgi:hypothetical protein